MVFQPRMVIEQGSDNGYRGITDDGELGGKGKKMACGASEHGASGEIVSRAHKIRKGLGLGGWRDSSLGLRYKGIGKPFSAQGNYYKFGPSDKWAHLFKRPFKSKLVAINNRSWVKKGDTGGGPSYRAEESVIEAEAGTFDTNLTV